ncbi:CarD family transcriptional regulator, partial [Muricomes intestini]|uniref:CarD family transcriptional regulator n=1 Tax=Muricomes intestini TaxID=1796634 RepID=UPI002FE18C94
MLEKRRKGEGILQITGCVNSQKTHLMYALGDGCYYKIIAYSSGEKAEKAYEEYRFLDENVYLYAARDLLFYHADIKGKYLVKQRMEVVQAILEAEEKEETETAGITVITTIDGFMDGVVPLKEVAGQRIHIAGTGNIDLTKLEKKLASMGYEREAQIEGPGQFAVRGGILDIFPLTEEMPVRIELWGDEVDSIRTFDIESQRSVERLDEVDIYPASETIGENVENVSFLDYFPRDKSLLFLDEPLRLIERADEVADEFLSSRRNREEAGVEDAEEELRVFTTKEIIEKMNRYCGIGLTILESKCGSFHVRDTYSLQTKGVNPYNNSFEMLTRDLKRLKRSGYRVILLSGSRTRAKRLAEDLRDYDLSSFYSEDMHREVQPGEIMAAYGHVSEGYEYQLLKFMVISESDIFGKQKRKKKRKVYEGQKIQDFSELKVGDYVVHENHGLGIYRGI